MNPQVSPWMIIADKQRLKAVEREQQERDLKNMLKLQYQKELEQQMRAQRDVRAKEKMKQKEQEKILINHSLQNQHKVLQMQKLKAQIVMQNNSRLDQENQYYKKARKAREELLQSQSRQNQNYQSLVAQELERIEAEKLEKKKKQVLNTLKSTMEQKKLQQKHEREQQNQYQNFKLKENEYLMQREEHFRQDYLQKLKNRAMTIDYGSHGAFQDNHHKSLVQRKREEWQNEQEYVKRARLVDQYEQHNRKLKVSMQQEYRNELHRQIIEREQDKKYNAQRQTHNDYETLARYQNYSRSVEAQKRQTEQRHKKQLLQYLQRQVEQKSKLPREPYLIQEKQLKINNNLLRESKGIIPGETLELDPARRKQIQTVAKAIASSPTKMDKNFFADRGKTIIY